MEEKILDTTVLMCPLPVLRARKVLKELPPQAILRVFSTDAASVMDFGVFCDQAGHKLLKQNEENGVYTFVILRGDN